MNDTADTAPAQPHAPPARERPLLWSGVVVAWFLILCFAPDPRPLSAPGWAVGAVRAAAGLDEAGGRVIATLILRAGSIALLGALLVLAIGTRRWSRRSLLAILLAPPLAIATLWVNFGYLPIRPQIQIAVVSAVLGAVAGLALRRNLLAAVTVVAATAGLFLWGTGTGIDDEFYVAARAVGQHVLAEADEVPDGEAGFLRLLEIAFAFAEDNSHGTDPVFPNKAAVLALGVILGEEQVAAVAKRTIDESRLPEVEALRARISLHGRHDWPRHFWVSAALTTLADDNRSITVGITKELMDTTPGGTGFSFTDVAADAAGNRFALAATRDETSARAMQRRLLAGARVSDFFPDIRDLPEGLTAEVFQEQYGGLGGEGTGAVVEEIKKRLAGCAALE